MKRLALTALATLLLATPMLASANEAQVTGNVNLYAGPDPSYPMIATLYAGTSVDVQGCTQGWEWCDVIVADNRGWIPGTYLQYYYENQPELVTDYGEQIGIPIVAFSLGLYWDRYYRSRPFYRDRDRWYHRPMPHRPPPRPFYGHGGRPDFDHRPDGNRGPDRGPDRGPGRDWNYGPDRGPDPDRDRGPDRDPRPDWNRNPNNGRGPTQPQPPQRPAEAPRPNPPQQAPQQNFRQNQPMRDPEPRMQPRGPVRQPNLTPQPRNPGNPGAPRPQGGDHNAPPQGHGDHGDHGDHKDDHGH